MFELRQEGFLATGTISFLVIPKTKKVMPCIRPVGGTEIIQF